jgi:hypothetical protein
MPAAVWFYYNESDIAGLDEDTLTLYGYNEDEKVWEDAACGVYQRYPEGNYMIVSVCKVGAFAILSPYSAVFLPLVAK